MCEYNFLTQHSGDRDLCVIIFDKHNIVTSWRGKPTRIRFVVGSGKRPKVQCIIGDAEIMRNSKIRIYNVAQNGDIA